MTKINDLEVMFCDIPSRFKLASTKEMTVMKFALYQNTTRVPKYS